MAYEAVVIGASAGGIAAVRALLAAIPRPLQAPLYLVQHLKARGAVDPRLVYPEAQATEVREAQDKDCPRAGALYIAPPGYHLLVEKDRTLALSVDEPVNFARPSIDVLFETAAEAYGDKLIGVIMTGANADGARGLKAVKDLGGLAIVQDPASCESPVMPESALRTTAVDHVRAPAAIGQLLAQLIPPAKREPTRG